MNIVLEGPDGSGKSTLAGYIGRALDIDVMSSTGPEKYPGEITDRIEKKYFARVPPVVFDRHPCVSQEIYGKFKPGGTRVPSHLLNYFYNQPNILIYCRSLDGLSRHVRAAHDSDEHMALVHMNNRGIVQLYEEWALERAHMIFRIGDSESRLVAALKGAMFHVR